MTNLEHMSYLVDRDICNSSVLHAWTSLVMVSGLASRLNPNYNTEPRNLKLDPKTGP